MSSLDSLNSDFASSIRDLTNDFFKPAEPTPTMEQPAEPQEPEKTQAAPEEARSEEKLKELLDELEGLVGLANVKADVKSLLNFIRVTKEREERGMKVPAVSYHLVFTGNPGTGKTTVARLIGQIYYHMGILPKGQLVESDRSSLVAGYLGQTALKTQKLIDEAMGGVLFVDEAYTLSENDDDSYGREAIETMLKAMEDHRDELVVIVAGYDGLMQQFIESNPGLQSRFNKYFHFEDYEGEELTRILERFCAKNDYVLEEGLRRDLTERFQKIFAERDEHFGNARYVRNVFEKAIAIQADRLAGGEDLPDEAYRTLTREDIDKAMGGEQQDGEN